MRIRDSSEEVAVPQVSTKPGAAALKQGRGVISLHQGQPCPETAQLGTAQHESACDFSCWGEREQNVQHPYLSEPYLGARLTPHLEH